MCSPAHRAKQKEHVCVTRMTDGMGSFMTFHSGQGGNDYEHWGLSFTSWLSGNGVQPKNSKVGKANGWYQHHPLNPMDKMPDRRIGQEVKSMHDRNCEWEREWKTVEEDKSCGDFSWSMAFLNVGIQVKRGGEKQKPAKSLCSFAGIYKSVMLCS